VGWSVLGHESIGQVTDSQHVEMENTILIYSSTRTSDGLHTLYELHNCGPTDGSRTNWVASLDLGSSCCGPWITLSRSIDAFVAGRVAAAAGSGNLVFASALAVLKTPGDI
jgi:hypothetical protein